MNDSMAYATDEPVPRGLPTWKAWAATVSAVLLGVVFLISGIWKVTDPFAAAVRMSQAKIPDVLSLPAALGFGIAEAFCAVLLLVPRFRRWGAWLAGILLVAFVIYIGALYNALRGEDCNCFPWIRRAVGPAFFAGDGALLLLAVIAGWWSRPSKGLRSASIILGAVCVFAFVLLGVHVTRQSGVQAPESVTVEGKAFSLRQGRVYLFFFDPECLHCAQQARELAKLDWGETKIVAVATGGPQFGPDFMMETGLKGVLASTSDLETLRKTFSFVDVPYGVAIENGHQRATFASPASASAIEALRKLQFLR